MIKALESSVPPKIYEACLSPWQVRHQHKPNLPDFERHQDELAFHLSSSLHEEQCDHWKHPQWRKASEYHIVYTSRCITPRSLGLLKSHRNTFFGENHSEDPKTRRSLTGSLKRNREDKWSELATEIKPAGNKNAEVFDPWEIESLEWARQSQT